jgi:hypothetical protein
MARDAKLLYCNEITVRACFITNTARPTDEEILRNSTGELF